MRTSHTLLLRLRYDPACDFNLVSVDYLSRGAPADRAMVQGPDIISLDTEYFTITGYDEPVCIPYHRIRAIHYGDRCIWQRLGS